MESRRDNLEITCLNWSAVPKKSRGTLGGRIIRSLILDVERSQELFRRRAQRQEFGCPGSWIGPIKKMYNTKIPRETKYQGCLGPGIGR